MGLYFACSHRSCRQGPTWKAVQHHFVSYGSQAAQLEIAHMYPTTSKNKVKRCRPSKTMTLLKDTHWLLIYIYSQKRVTFPLSLIESVNQSSKFWIKICGFHAQVFDWFSRVFHCLFTGFSRSFHALFTLWVWSGICLKLWSPVYIYTSTHLGLIMPSKHMSLPKTKLNFVVVKAPVKLCRRLSGIPPLRLGDCVWFHP